MSGELNLRAVHVEQTLAATVAERCAQVLELVQENAQLRRQLTLAREQLAVAKLVEEEE